MNTSDPVVLPYVALISTDPPLTAVTIPVFVTVAMDVFDEPHLACGVTVWLEPSARTAIAVNWEEVPSGGGVPTTMSVATATMSVCGDGAVGLDG